MESPDKIVLEHAGALGDYLLAWPAFLSIVRRFPDSRIYHVVPSAHAPWISPLAAPCPPDIRRGLNARFAGREWPETLHDTLVVRPGLATRPDLPDWPGFWFLHGMATGRTASPTILYREALATRGVPFATDFAAAFRAYFGRHEPRGNTALLFPGAGHADKAWLLRRFETLAEQLRRHGIRPVFVLGPVEREQGIVPGDGDILEPENLEVLAKAIRSARFVVGPDCGPMHLAGMHGVPGVALFGPTAPAQWGPLGLEIVTAGLPCAPCTAMTSGTFAAGCPRPLPCLEGISVEMVWERLRQWVD
jgi:ADP-heptose:LPS heptosyltransferase